MRRTLFLKSLFCYLLSFPFTATFSQELKIGDIAPKIEAYEWIKGDSITALKKGTPYIVEFGATWCKPCARVIPELNRLAKKYQDQAEVIGVFVQEVNFGMEDASPPPYIKRVKRYVEKQGDDMSYHVAVDGPKKTIESNWINAFGRSVGVPQTFVIDKKGRIAGHFNGTMNGVEDLLIAILNDD